MLLLLATGTWLINNPQRVSGRHWQGSTACIHWAKKLEGRKLSGVYSLTCTVSPRKLTGSSLTAQYLEFTGAPKDESLCVDPSLDGYRTPGEQYCIGWWGIVLSDGRMFPRLGNSPSSGPLDYDYCYSLEAGPGSSLHLPKAQPTIHDLYFYQGDLYDRDVFTNVMLKTDYGTCTLNGTTLTHPDKTLAGNETQITNVRIAYEAIPISCEQASLVKTMTEFYDCINFVTAANPQEALCYSNRIPQVNADKISGYKAESQVYYGQYINSGCESVFVQRMAALDRCQQIVKADLRTACEPKVSHPATGVERVTKSV